MVPIFVVDADVGHILMCVVLIIFDYGSSTNLPTTLLFADSDMGGLSTGICGRYNFV